MFSLQEPPTVWCPGTTEGTTLSGRDAGMVTLTPDSATSLSDTNAVLVPVCEVENNGNVTQMAVIGTFLYKYGVNTITCSATDTQEPYFTGYCQFMVTITGW